MQHVLHMRNVLRMRSTGVAYAKYVAYATYKYCLPTGLFLERAREPDALYFAPGHRIFAGREPGLLSQSWLGIFYLRHFANSGSPRFVCHIDRFLNNNHLNGHQITIE